VDVIFNNSVVSVAPVPVPSGVAPVPVTPPVPVLPPVPPPNPNEGPGGPILVLYSSLNPFSRYIVEILRNEGLNYFAVRDIASITSLGDVQPYQVVILGEVALTVAQASILTTWTTNGGTFIAFRPDFKLSSLLGLTSIVGQTLTNKYLRVDTNVAPGIGIVSDSIQFHGTADLYIMSVQV
jgi:large repetitive protein